MASSLPLVTEENRRRVPRDILLLVFLRGVLLQAGFNPRTLQGLGWAFAMTPALSFLYPEGSAREAAMRRHLGHLNTHPYFAAALLGAAVHFEERLASGLTPASTLDAFRQALASPLAAVGDAFFWSALRPVCALTAVLTVPLWGPWAAVAFLLAYNLVHLSVRVWGFVVGYRHAEGLIESVGRLRLPALTGWLRRLGAVLAGVVVVVVVVVPGEARPTPGMMAVGALLTLTLAGRVRGWQVALAVLGVALLLGLLN